MGFLIIILIGYAPLFYNIHKRLRGLEEENKTLRNEIEQLKQKL